MNINEQEICDSYINGTNIYPIKLKYKLGYSKIKSILHKHNISIRDGRRITLAKEEEKKICDAYTSGLSMETLAKMYNIDYTTVETILSRNGISPRTHREANRIRIHKKRAWYKIDLTEAKKKYIDEKLSLNETAKCFDVAVPTLKRFLISNDINVREGTEPEKNRVERDIWSKYPTVEVIKKYIDECSAETIGKDLNISRTTIYRILKRNNIKTRTIEEWEKTRKRWHKSYALPSGKILYLQGYEPQFLDYVFSNSLLGEDEITSNVKSIKYVENDKPRFYFPDFYIPKFNLIAEIKSSWILKRQTAHTQYLKQQATIKAGFDYILILDNDFSVFTSKYFKDYNETQHNQ